MQKRKNNSIHCLFTFIFIGLAGCVSNVKKTPFDTLYFKLVAIEHVLPKGNSMEPVSITELKIRAYNIGINKVEIPLDSINREYSIDNVILLKQTKAQTSTPIYVLPIKFDGYVSYNDTEKQDQPITILKNISVNAKDSVDLIFSNGLDRGLEIMKLDYFDKVNPNMTYKKYMDELFANDYLIMLKLDTTRILIKKSKAASILLN